MIEIVVEEDMEIELPEKMFVVKRDEYKNDYMIVASNSSLYFPQYDEKTRIAFVINKCKTLIYTEGFIIEKLTKGLWSIVNTKLVVNG